MYAQTKNKSKIRGIVIINLFLVILLGIFIFFGVQRFYQANERRLLQEDKMYLMESTRQKNQLVQTTFQLKIGAVTRLANSWASELPQGNYLEQLRQLSGSQAFENLIYVNASGHGYTSNNLEGDYQHKDFYLQGMKGKTGTTTLMTETGARAIVSYAPVKQAGEIVGVLAGLTSKKSVETLLKEYIYDFKANVFLCDERGKILFYSSEHNFDMVKNITDTNPNPGKDRDRMIKKMLTTMSTHKTLTMKYFGTSGVNSYIRMVPVKDTHWTLVMSFPSAAEKKLQGQANKSAQSLMTVISTSLIAYISLIVIFTFTTLHRERRLAEQAKQLDHDGMTGLFNRRAYDENLARIPTDGNYLYFAIDVNELKKTNDNLGHAAGDELLMGAAKCMKTCFAGGKVYRIGGDEFVAVIKATPESGKILRQRLHELCTNWHGKKVKELSMSVGFVSLDEYPDKKPREIIALADERMYLEKSAFYQQSGHNRRR
ncbi:sensor domain-containing diguanylate cyclase [Ligilactobacillus equi]